MLDIVQELERNGQSLQHFCRELARYWRNLLVAKIAGKADKADCRFGPRNSSRCCEIAAQFQRRGSDAVSADDSRSVQDLCRHRCSRDLHLELGLIKLVQVGKLQPIEEAIAGLADRGPSETAARNGAGASDGSAEAGSGDRHSAAASPAPVSQPSAGDEQAGLLRSNDCCSSRSLLRLRSERDTAI